VPKDLRQQSGPDRLAAMHGDHGRPTIRVTQQVVGAANARDLEAVSLEGPDDLAARKPRRAGSHDTRTR
jgi:hypothetical protein